jgi:hypothetical protein
MVLEVANASAPPRWTKGDFFGEKFRRKAEVNDDE